MRVVLVTGDRNWGSESWDEKLLTSVLRMIRPDILIEGDAKGADRMAGEWAHRNGYRPLDAVSSIPPDALLCIPRLIIVPAEWGRYGRSAGPIRNSVMRKLLEHCRERGWETSVEAFHHDLAASKGTAHMVADAEKHGLVVNRHG